MVLDRHEPRVLRQLGDFDELAVGRDARDDEPVVLDRLEVGLVELVAVAVALASRA
jgi:hypothetical protein